MSATRRWTSFVLMALLCAGSSALSTIEQQTQGPDRQRRRAAGPLSPDEALAGFELEPGHRIELAAAEPLIRDPVAIAFDERGRMYVVENRGYPGPLEGAPQPAPRGVIALLEDTNRDGRFDKRTDFAAISRIQTASCRGTAASSSRALPISCTSKTRTATVLRTNGVWS